MNHNVDNMKFSLEKFMSENSAIKAYFWISIYSGFYQSLLQNLVFTTRVDTGFISKEGNCTFIGNSEARHLITRELFMKITPVCELHSAGYITLARKHLVENQLFQPFAQVFREYFQPNSFDEYIEKWKSIEFLNYEFNKCLQHRGWVISLTGKRRKFFKNAGLYAVLDTNLDSNYPSNEVIDRIKQVKFQSRTKNTSGENNNSDTWAIPAFMKCVILENIHFALCNSSINALELEFAPALASFVVLGLEAQGWINVQVSNNQLTCTKPEKIPLAISSDSHNNLGEGLKDLLVSESKTTVEIDLKPFSIISDTIEDFSAKPKNNPLRVRSVSLSKGDKGSQNRRGLIGDYFPHPPSRFWQTHLAAINTALSEEI